MQTATGQFSGTLQLVLSLITLFTTHFGPILAPFWTHFGPINSPVSALSGLLFDSFSLGSVQLLLPVCGILVASNAPEHNVDFIMAA